MYVCIEDEVLLLTILFRSEIKNLCYFRKNTQYLHFFKNLFRLLENAGSYQGVFTVF